MFRTRLISGIILVILAVLFNILGGDILLAVTGLISLIGMYELYRVLNIHKDLLAIIGYLACVVFFVNLRFGFIPDILMFVFGYMIILMFIYVFAYPKYDAAKLMTVFFGVFYVAGMLSYIYKIRMLEGGLYLTFLIFICSWGCDTFAYCFGKLFGKHKMSPRLSPKKSVEGAIGGIVGAIAVGAIYGAIVGNYIGSIANPVLIFAVMSGVAGLASMVGDLSASAIKRNYDIKDYGKLIPGHGGILDRFDSVIFIAPLIYYIIIFIK